VTTCVLNTHSILYNSGPESILVSKVGKPWCWGSTRSRRVLQPHRRQEQQPRRAPEAPDPCPAGAPVRATAPAPGRRRAADLFAPTRPTAWEGGDITAAGHPPSSTAPAAVPFRQAPKAAGSNSGSGG